MSTYGRTERRRLVAVVSSAMRETSHGLGSPLGRRWWELTLHCGHVVERQINYTRIPRRGRTVQTRRKSDALPPPQHARCDECPVLP